MANTSLVAKRNELVENEARFKRWSEEAGNGDDFDLMKVKDLSGDDVVAKAKEYTDLSARVAQLQGEVDALVEVEKLAKAQAVPAAPEVATPPAVLKGDLGSGREIDALIQKAWTPSNRNISASEGKEVDLEGLTLKALFSTTSYAPESVRSGMIVPFASAPPDLIDVLPQIPVDQAAFVYMEQITRTAYANATPALEGGTYAENTTTFAQKMGEIRKITTSQVVTDESIEDNPSSLPAYLVDDLSVGLRQSLCNQLIAGNGTAPNLKGILDYTVGTERQAPTISANTYSNIGLVTQAASETISDAIDEAVLQCIERAFTQPTLILMSYRTWNTIANERANTGAYIHRELGSRPVKMLNDDIPVMCSHFIPNNRVIVGDFMNYARVLDRRGIMLDYTNSHDTDFTSGQVRWRASLRAGLVLTRPAAFWRVDLT